MEDLTRTCVTPGVQLGPYKIERQIGAGGMGSVYRAIDTRLGRVVAVKIAGERYNDRFQSEARAISRLNHPHICTLYDVGPNFLVMELIEGSTLDAALTKGALPPETAARYGAQIADALAEAHSLGILHRDLKPSNIMVTRHGVKVLDFGLAKFLQQTQTHAEPAKPSLTATGVIIGTPLYMAPEQVEGREPGVSTDLFALGLTLYEMVVGKLPFPGASLGQMISSGSRASPLPPSRARDGVPASVDSLVARLLEGDQTKRPQSASDVARELSALADRFGAPRARPQRHSLYAMLAVVLLFSLAAALYWRSQRREQIAPDPASYIQLTSFTDAAVNPALSPDGRMLAFYRSDNPFNTPGEIWGKLLPDGEPIQLTHDPHLKYNIAFSPDGARVAYTAVHGNFNTYTVSALGGDPELFLTNSGGLSWLDDRHLLFSQITAGVHMEVVTSRTDRSDLREIYSPAQERGMAHYSYLSPDGKWVLLAEMNPQWLPCRVASFLGGSPAKQIGPICACRSAAWSRDGKSVYLGVEVAGRQHLWRQRFPDGQPEQFTFGATEEAGIAMSPDGHSLVTSVFTRQNAVWLHDSRSDHPISTQGYADSTPPVFSRDGKRLYYLLRRNSPDAPAELWLADLATGKNVVLLPGISIREFDISPDEKETTYSTQAAGQLSQLWIASLDRSAPPRRISAAGDSDPHFGPNHEIVFRQSDGKSYYLGAMMPDGTARRKASLLPILDIFQISPDRRFIAINATSFAAAGQPRRHVLAIPLDGAQHAKYAAGTAAQRGRRTDATCTSRWDSESSTIGREKP